MDAQKRLGQFHCEHCGEATEYEYTVVPRLPDELVDRVRRVVEIDNAEWAEFRSRPDYSPDQEPYITILLRDLLASIDGEIAWLA